MDLASEDSLIIRVDGNAADRPLHCLHRRPLGVPYLDTDTTVKGTGTRGIVAAQSKYLITLTPVKISDKHYSLQ